MPTKPPPQDDWVDVPDSSDNSDWQDVSPTPAKRTASPEFMSSMNDVWGVANKPLTDYITDKSGNRILDPQAAANYYDDPNARTEDQWKIPSWVPVAGGGTYRSLLSGMLEGGGNVVTGLTSPLNLATMGSMKGAGALAESAPSASRALGLTGRALSAPVAIHGGMTAADPNLSASERLFGVAEAAGGVAGMGSGPPIRRPQTRIPPPEVQPSAVDLTNQRLAEIRQRADQTVKAGPEGPMQPNEIEPAKARLNELIEKAKTGDITHPEVIEGQQLDKKLREVNFGEQPKSTELPPPEQGGLPQRPFDRRKAVTDYQSKLDEAAAQSEIPPEAAALEQQIPPEMQQSFSTGEENPFSKYGPNASGESAASAEALSRQEGMRARGEQYVVYDKAGNERPLVGPEAVDYSPQAGETYGIKTPRGFVKLTENGGKIPDGTKVIKGRKTEYPGYKGGEQPKATADDATTGLRQRLDNAVSKPRLASEFGDSAGETAKVAEEAKSLPDGPEKDNIIRRALGANKAILTSWDLSAPGRQGKAFILNKSWWNSLDDMVRAWGSKDAAKMIDQSIVDHPSGYFKPTIEIKNAAGEVTGHQSFAEKVGLDIAPHEEMFNTTIGKAVGKLGLVERSSRAHTAFLNKLRSDQFISFMEDSKAAGKDPTKDLRLAKTYAKFINDATGRGSLNMGRYKLERNANALNDLFFAPRNMSGQIRTWNAVLNPYKYYQADPVLRKQALRSLFAIAGTGLAVGEMAKLVPGASVSNDPTSADYRKIKIGNTRIDPFGGYQQFPVAAMKLLTGESTSTTTGKTTDLSGSRFGQQTRASVAERFFVNRLAPLPSFVWAWMNNRDFDGKPFEVKKALFERTFPIAMKDIIDMAKTDPALAAIMAAPTTLGLTGTQTYSGR